MVGSPPKPGDAAPVPFDINAAIKAAGALEISVSAPESLEDANHRRWKDKTLFLLGLCFMVGKKS
jgi:hypothetical protein